MGPQMISKAVEVIFRGQWGQEISLGVPGGRWGGPGGPRGLRETSRGSHWAIGMVWGVSWWLMRHMCLYTWGQDFHCTGAGPPEVVQEALADLKSDHWLKNDCTEKVEIWHLEKFITKQCDTYQCVASYNWLTHAGNRKSDFWRPAQI